jgi:hypothetical protein
VLRFRIKERIHSMLEKGDRREEEEAAGEK